jgi:hypothetical protein
MKMLFAALALATVLVACPGTMTNTYKATLNGANERPNPVTTNGTGTVTATLDLNTKVLTLTGSYASLSGAVVAPGAHIHGPADVNSTAGILFQITYAEGTTAGNGTLSLTTPALTDAQITQLNSGQWYVNVHTALNQPGEIRGQLVKQ